MPTLCFGGSFNPIHFGHLRCAEAVAKSAGFEQILLIPSAQPPHKPNATDLAPAEDRLAMCRLAAADDPLFAVSDIETRRGGPSYTIDTAAELKQQGFVTVHWLIGADMLMFLPHWHRAADLIRQVDFIVMARPGWTIDWSALPEEFRGLRSHMVAAPLIDISATEIRRRVREGRPIDDLVPAAVAGYIVERELYRA